MVETKPVTCPETGHLEHIEVEHTSAGSLILRCTRFSPPCDVSCTRECSRRMDRRDRTEHLLPERERVLVLVANYDGTRAIAERIAEELRGDQLEADVVDAIAPSLPPPEDYDAVVIGCSRRFGSPVRSLVEYTRVHFDALAAMPTFFFGGEALGRMSQTTGWHPTSVLASEHLATEDLHRFAARIADEVR